MQFRIALGCPTHFFLFPDLTNIICFSNLLKELEQTQSSKIVPSS